MTYDSDIIISVSGRGGSESEFLNGPWAFTADSERPVNVLERLIPIAEGSLVDAESIQGDEDHGKKSESFEHINKSI